MLAISALTKMFGGFTAVNGVSFEVKQGEILGLIGPNGSGKSTTFNLIAGTLAPTAGSVRFLGHDIHGLDTTLYGLMLVLFIIFMPKGILGAAIEAWNKRRPKPATAAA